jgi:hypothetical protein
MSGTAFRPPSKPAKRAGSERAGGSSRPLQTWLDAKQLGIAWSGFAAKGRSVYRIQPGASA